MGRKQTLAACHPLDLRATSARGQQRLVGYLGCMRQSGYSNSMSIAEWRISQLNQPAVYWVEISTSCFAKETMNFTMSG
jgi:hypothetical protein